MGVHDGHRDRKREQFLRCGAESFADHELLELLLYYAIPQRDTNPIAHALIERFGSLQAVLSAPAEELLEAVMPEVGIISVGQNRFGHPTQEAMDRMAGAGMALRRTDEEGNILIQVGK